MKVRDIAEFKENKDINALLAEFQKRLLLDTKFGDGIEDVTAQIETTIADVGLIGIEIVKSYGTAWNDDKTRVDIYRRCVGEWILCYTRDITKYATTQLGVWDTIAAYREKLKRTAKNESKRKYRVGEPVKSMDELIEQEFVYWHEKIYHRGWFMSWPLNMASKAVRRGEIFKSIHRGDETNG